MNQPNNECHFAIAVPNLSGTVCMDGCKNLHSQCQLNKK